MIYFSQNQINIHLAVGPKVCMASISDSPYKNIKMRPPTDSKTTMWKRKLRSASVSKTDHRRNLMF